MEAGSPNLRQLFTCALIALILSGCAGRQIQPYSDELADVSLPVPMPAPRNGPDIENGTVTAESRPAHERLTPSAIHKTVSDDRLRTNILAAIVDDPAVNPFQFRYVVEDGNVEVLGEGTSRQKKRVGETVARVRGVRAVENGVMTPDETESARHAIPVSPVSDEEIERDIQDAIDRDPRAGFSRIEIQAREGIVILIGNVPNLRTSEAIEKRASQTRGVKQVTNRLEVKTRYIRDDDRLVRDVKAALALEPLLHSEKLAVSAKGGVINLAGEVSAPWKRERAAELGAEVFGVVAIRNHLHVGGISVEPPVSNAAIH